MNLSSYSQENTKTQKDQLKNDEREVLPHMKSDIDSVRILAHEMNDTDSSGSVRTLEDNISDHSKNTRDSVRTLKEKFERLKLENPDIDEDLLNDIVYKHYGHALNLNYVEAPQIAEAAKVIAMLNDNYKMPVVIDSGATSNFISRQIIKDFNLESQIRRCEPLHVNAVGHKMVTSNFIVLNWRFFFRTEINTTVAFFILDIPTRDVFLGLPFIQQYQGFIDWKVINLSFVNFIS